MRRKRRSRPIWFPTLGTPTETVGSSQLLGNFSVTTPGTDPQDWWSIFPLTFDQPQDAGQLDPSTDVFNEIVGNDWLLYRLVGNLYIHYSSVAVASDGGDLIETNGPPVLNVCAGFFVARAEDQDVGALGANVPIGLGNTTNAALSSARYQADYSPANLNCIREPWIWRRTWKLASAAFAAQYAAQVAGTTTVVTSGDWPQTNTRYHGLTQGPRLDTKIKRKIAQDERLWLTVCAWPDPQENVFDNITDPQVAAQVHIQLDYRILGKIVKARQRGTF